MYLKISTNQQPSENGKSRKVRKQYSQQSTARSNVATVSQSNNLDVSNTVSENVRSIWISCFPIPSKIPTLLTPKTLGKQCRDTIRSASGSRFQDNKLGLSWAKLSHSWPKLIRSFDLMS